MPLTAHWALRTRVGRSTRPARTPGELVPGAIGKNSSRSCCSRSRKAASPRTGEPTQQGYTEQLEKLLLKEQEGGEFADRAPARDQLTRLQTGCIGGG